MFGRDVVLGDEQVQLAVPIRGGGPGRSHRQLAAPSRSDGHRGQVAGLSAVEPDGAAQGFIQDRRGNTVSFAAPAASITFAEGLNDRGQVVLPRAGTAGLLPLAP